MKAQDDLGTMLRAEVQLDIQTVREEHLRDAKTLCQAYQNSEEKSRLAAQDDLNALRTDQLSTDNLIEELRTAMEALSARV